MAAVKKSKMRELVKHSSGNYLMRIGYWFNSDGKRVERTFYFGRDESTATLDSVKRVVEWRRIKSSWGHLTKVFAKMFPPTDSIFGLAGDQSRDATGLSGNQRFLFSTSPIWPEGPIWGNLVRESDFRHLISVPDLLPVWDNDIAELNRFISKFCDPRLLMPSDLHIVQATPVEARLETGPKAIQTKTAITIEQAKDLFLGNKRSKIGIAGKGGLKPRSFNNIQTNVNLVLGITNAEKPTDEVLNRKPPIDIKKPIAQLTKKEIEQFINFWMALPGDLSATTAVNYLKAFKQFLDWCAESEIGEDHYTGFRMPNGASKMFRLSIKTKPKIIDYDKDVLKAIKGAANEKTWLYVLLGLNCGFYASDISDLIFDDLTQYNGENCIWRGRSKTSHQNDFDTLHYLWPETYAYLKKHMAKRDNPHGRLLLSQDGKPLVTAETDKQRSDAVFQCINRAKTKAMVKFQFKQLRKIGATEIARHVPNDVSQQYRIDPDNVARLYLGHSTNGVLSQYKKETYEPLIAALKAWRERLIKDGVLTMPLTKEQEEAAKKAQKERKAMEKMSGK